MRNLLKSFLKQVIICWLHFVVSLCNFSFIIKKECISFSWMLENYSDKIENLLIVIGMVRDAAEKILNNSAHNINPFTIMKSL